jgi:H+/gluconate symporter-like permease
MLHAVVHYPTYELAVLLAGFALLTVLALRGLSIFVAAPLCAVLILAASGRDPLAGMTGPFMAGFADYLRRFYLIFALGAAFGQLLDKSAAAAVIARAVAACVGSRWACLAVVLACAVLTYGGVSLFVVGFSVYPLAVQLFRAGDLPRRFIPASIAFGSITFTMTSAGSPEIQNLIPIQYLVSAHTGEPLTDARAGWPVSLIVAVLMFAAGQSYLEWSLRRARAKGERFEPRPGDPEPLADPAVPPSAPCAASGSTAVARQTVVGADDTATSAAAGISASPAPATSAATSAPVVPAPAVQGNKGLAARPGLLRALLPLAVTLAALNVLPWACRGLGNWLAGREAPVREGGAGSQVPAQAAHAANLRMQAAALLRSVPEDPTLAIFCGVLMAMLALRRFCKRPWECVGRGFVDGLIAIGATCSVVGFGTALVDLPAFQRVAHWVTHLPGDPLWTAALSVALIAGLAGSASGGQGLALPLIKPLYVDQLGVPPRALHRIVSLASGSLDTMPANGYVVMLIRVICGEVHSRAYWPLCVTCTLLPAAGTLLAIALFKLVPAWGYW